MQRFPECILQCLVLDNYFSLHGHLPSIRSHSFPDLSSHHPLGKYHPQASQEHIVSVWSQTRKNPNTKEAWGNSLSKGICTGPETVQGARHLSHNWQWYRILHMALWVPPRVSPEHRARSKP